MPIKRAQITTLVGGVHAKVGPESGVRANKAGQDTQRRNSVKVTELISQGGDFCSPRQEFRLVGARASLAIGPHRVTAYTHATHEKLEH